MARVPVVSAPSVALAPIARERFRPADNDGGAFGGLARGLVKLGGTGLDVAQAQDKLLAEQDEAGAKAIDAEAIPGFQKALTDFRSLQGSNASAEALAAAKQRLTEQRGEYLKRATTPRMQGMLGQALDVKVQSAIGQMEEHSVKQIGVAWEAGSLSRQAASAEAALAATDPAERRMHMDTGLNEMRALATRRGVDADTLKVEEFKYKSGIHSAVALDMADADNVDGALAYKEEHRDEISAADETRINKALKDPLERRQTIADTAGILRPGVGTGAVNPGEPFDPLGGAGRMPVNGGGYGASRDYGSHNAVDIPAGRGTPIKPERTGTARVSRSAKGGNIVTIDYGDGTVDKFMHLDQVRVKDGDQVSANTVVGTVGMTGRTSGPHLHWQRLQGGKAVNPLEQHGTGGPQQAPERHDLNSALAAVDKRADDGDWSPERRERAKREVERLVSQDEMLIRRREDEAERQAWDAIDNLPDNKLTSMDQIPAGIRSRLTGRQRVQFEEEIARNTKPPELKANGDAAVALEIIANTDEETFAKMDLRPFRSQMTAAEFAKLAVDQSKLRNKPKDQPHTASLRSEIDTAIKFYGQDIDVGKDITDRKNDKARQQYARISGAMRTYLDRATDGGKRKPTDDEMKAAFDHATMEVIVRGGGTFGGDITKRRYEVDGGRIGIAMPNDVKARIERSFAANRRRLPTAEETMQIYLANKGKPGFWR